MHGVRKHPNQRIRACSSHHLLLVGVPDDRPMLVVPEARKECERWQKNAWGQKTFRPTHKRLLQSPLYFLLEHPTVGMRQ